MRSRTVHLLSVISFVVLFFTTTAVSQTLQSGQEQRNTLNEIEEMRRDIRQRKAQNQENQKILADLQRVLSGEADQQQPSTPVSKRNDQKNSSFQGQETTEPTDNNYNNSSEARHLAEKQALEAEIEFLKRQLEIANQQSRSNVQHQSQAQLSPATNLIESEKGSPLSERDQLEIDIMREQIRKKRENSQQQRLLIQELQQVIEGL